MSISYSATSTRRFALAMAQVSNEKKILHIVPGGHTDRGPTSSSCHWNVFRVCNTTQTWKRPRSRASSIKEYV